MQSITLDVIVRVVFGVDGVERRDELRRLILAVARIGRNPFMLFATRDRRLGPNAPWARFIRARDALQAELDARPRQEVSTTPSGSGTIETYCVAYHHYDIDGVQQQYVMGIRYEDTLRRQNGKWEIVECSANFDWMTGQSRLFAMRNAASGVAGRHTQSGT